MEKVKESATAAAGNNLGQTQDFGTYGILTNAPSNTHTDISTNARDLIFGLSLCFHPSDSPEPLLLTDVLLTDACAGTYR